MEPKANLTCKTKFDPEEFLEALVQLQNHLASDSSSIMRGLDPTIEQTFSKDMQDLRLNTYFQVMA